MQVMWDDLRLFVSVARSGSLAGAVQETGKSSPTLLRAVNRLEDALNRPLFSRGRRGYTLTDFGSRVFEDALTTERSVRRLCETASNGAVPRIVRISAGTWISKLLLRKMLFTPGQFPNTRIELESAESHARIEHREVDIGLRNKRPTQRGLASQKLFEVQYSVYAAEQYSDRYDLPWINIVADTPSARWVNEQSKGEANLTVSAPAHVLDALRAGAGMCVLPTFIGDGETGIVRIGTVISELHHACWLTLNESTRHNECVRCVVNAVVSTLSEANRP